MFVPGRGGAKKGFKLGIPDGSEKGMRIQTTRPRKAFFAVW